MLIYVDTPYDDCSIRSVRCAACREYARRAVRARGAFFIPGYNNSVCAADTVHTKCVTNLIVQRAFVSKTRFAIWRGSNESASHLSIRSLL